MTTRLRTWLLISGLSALLVGFGALVGGTAGLLLFAGIAAVNDSASVIGLVETRTS